MDLKVYYKKIRDTAATLPKDVVVVSLPTEDGGVGGVFTEVPREVAAKMMADGSAQLASADDAQAFRELIVESKRKADEELAAARVPFQIVLPAERFVAHPAPAGDAAKPAAATAAPEQE